MPRLSKVISKKLNGIGKNALVSNTIWSFGAKLSAMVFYFIADIFYARILGVEKYAEWAFFFAIANMAFYIGWFGINLSAKVHISKSKEKEKCLGAALQVRVVFSVIISFEILLLADTIAERTGYPKPYENLRSLMYLMAGMVFFNSFTEFFKHLYIGIQEYKKLFVITTMEYLSYCLFGIIFLLMYNNAVSIALGYCMAGLAILVCNILMTVRKCDLKTVWNGIKDITLQKDILKYALPMVLTSIGGLILTEMDTFMLGLMSSKEQVAVYSISKQIVSKSTHINMAIWTGTVTSLAMITKDNLEDKKRQFKKVSRINAGVSLAVCLCFLLFGKIAIHIIYGDDYSTASLLLVTLIPYQFLHCVSSLNANFLDFMGHARNRAIWYLSVIFINLTLNWLLIPMYGAKGAAVATSLSLVPYTIYCLYDVRNIFRNMSKW